VETSTFSSEFVALHIAVELIEALCYKLHMFGVPINGPCTMFCDNEAAVKNSTISDSTLKKKHNAITYHHVHEAVASGVIRIQYMASDHNLADLLTKPLTHQKIHMFCEQILH
jgi:hypothetical protein